MASELRAGEIKLWGFFLGNGHGLYKARRFDKDTVVFEIGGKTYRIKLSVKADEHTALVGFDGFFLRHGLAGSSKVLPYEYNNNVPWGQIEIMRRGPEHISLETNPSNVSAVSNYEDEDSKKDWDYAIVSSTRHPEEKACASWSKSSRHFVAIPKMKDGSHSLVCQLKPRSLERRYVMIVASYQEVKFTSCNSY